MEMLRAFVGHSFSPEDEGVVGSFLKYLNVIGELNRNFCWEHAEAPQSERIDDKVLAYFEGKNLFIGICTRNEQVIDPAALRRRWWPITPNFLASATKWKPSDWVIQEIGLAVGRRMKIILLLEEGVRTPGALQGNLEFIHFQRVAPEKGFSKLLGMIAALTPDRADDVATTADHSKPDTKLPVIEAPSEFDFEPKAVWKQWNWRVALMHWIAMDDAATIDKLTEAYFSSPFCSTDLSKDEWLADCEYYRIYFGKKGSLPSLLKLADRQPSSAHIATNVAKSYMSYEEFAKAADVFKKAEEKALTDEERVELLGQAALAFHKAGQDDESIAMADRMRNLNSGDDGVEGKVLGWERHLAEVKGDHHRCIGAMERQLELEPGDAKIRFSLAYKYSELDKQDALALLHYTRIPWDERDAMTWNNLGWAYECLELPIKSVQAYRQAEKMGESLAMSNLARKLLAAGFHDEAANMLDSAVRIKDYNKAVDGTLSSLKDAPEVEDEKEKALLNEARPTSEFYRGFGSAAANKLSAPLDGDWKGPLCTLKVRVEGETFYAVGQYEVGLGPLASIMSREGQIYDANLKTTHVVEYSGHIEGRTITGGTISRAKADNSRKSTLLTGDPRPTVLMWVSDDCQFIHVLERDSSGSPRFHSLNRM